MRTENRVVLASPELRMAPLGSDNFDPNAGLRTRQYTLNQGKSGLDFGVHYTMRHNNHAHDPVHLLFS